MRAIVEGWWCASAPPADESRRTRPDKTAWCAGVRHVRPGPRFPVCPAALRARPTGQVVLDVAVVRVAQPPRLVPPRGRARDRAGLGLPAAGGRVGDRVAAIPGEAGRCAGRP